MRVRVRQVLTVCLTVSQRAVLPMPPAVAGVIRHCQGVRCACSNVAHTLEGHALGGVHTGLL
jgi:hypothetical protein